MARLSRKGAVLIELSRVVPHGNEIVVVVFQWNYLRPGVKVSEFVFVFFGVSVQ